MPAPDQLIPPALLRPLDGAPCGVDLRQDGAFLKLLRDIETREVVRRLNPETKEEEIVAPGREPEWPELRDDSITLLARSRDLQLLLVLTLSLLKTEGMVGLEAGLSALRTHVEVFWDQLHPLPDPDFPDDHMLRVSLIESITTPLGTERDPYMFLRRASEAPLAESRQLGRFSLRDLAVASGKAKAAPDAKPVDFNTIEAAFAETETSRLETLREAIEGSLGHVDAIAAFLNSRPGLPSVDFGNVRRVLNDAISHVRRHLEKRGSGAAITPASVPGTGGTAAVVGPGTAPRAPGGISSTRDLVESLSAAARFCAAQEPSSPIPLFLEAAIRLVGKPYFEVVKLVPAELVSTLESIAGVQRSE